MRDDGARRIPHRHLHAGPAGGADNGDQRQREDDLEQHGHEGSVSAIAIECQYGRAHLSDARVAALAARRPRRVQELELAIDRSEKHTSELQSLILLSYSVFFLKKNI